MLNSLNQPLTYFCLATLVFGVALYLTPKSSLFKKNLAKVLSQSGKVGVFFPLISSIIVSFVLTLLVKIFQG